MAAVVVTGVKLLENPAMFNQPFKFEITFECLTPLEDDIEWMLTYVGSPDTTQDDQQLDSVLIGPVSVGVNKFVFEAAAPDIHKLPKHEWIGTTVVLLQCAYRDQVFFRVGYFVMNEYTGGDLIEHPDSIAAGQERQRKARSKTMAALQSGEGMEDFEDYVRENALLERRKVAGTEGDDDEDEDDDEESDAEDEEDDPIVVEDDDEEQEENDDEYEEGSGEDEEDEESDEEGAPGGKRPPPGVGGKVPPPGVGGKVPPSGGVGGKTPPPGASENSASGKQSSDDSTSASGNASATTLATGANGKESEGDAAPTNEKKRARPADNEADAKKDNSNAAAMGEEPEFKKRKLSEYPNEVIEAYLAYSSEDGPRWYINANPDLIQRNVLMEDPRVTLFPIQWADPLDPLQ